MNASQRVITDLRTRLKLMSKVSQTNKVNAQQGSGSTCDCGGQNPDVEYYKGEIEGLRLADAVLTELIHHYVDKE